MSGFLRGKLEAGRNKLGLCIARDDFKIYLKAKLGVFTEF